MVGSERDTSDCVLAQPEDAAMPGANFEAKLWLGFTHMREGLQLRMR